MRYKKKDRREQSNFAIEYHFFDMDSTLINNDCDHSWKVFTVDKGLSPKSDLELADKFFDDYNRGELVFDEFMEFQLREFRGNSVEKMAEICYKHFLEFAKPNVYLEAFNYINELKENGCKVYILTSTNTTIAKPVADYFMVDGLYGTELEVDENGNYTGKISGCFGGTEGKVTKVQEFCEKYGVDKNNIAYYGDSINDKYVLDYVGKAYAVNPSTELKELAVEKDWEIIEFK